MVSISALKSRVRCSQPSPELREVGYTLQVLGLNCCFSALPCIDSARYRSKENLTKWSLIHWKYLLTSLPSWLPCGPAGITKNLGRNEEENRLAICVLIQDMWWREGGGEKDFYFCFVLVSMDVVIRNLVVSSYIRTSIDNSKVINKFSICTKWEVG